MKTSLCIVLSSARASPLDYFQHLLVSHMLIHTHTFFATMKLTFLLLSGTSQQLLDKLLSCEFVNSGCVELLFLHPVVCFLAASDVQVHYSVE